MVPATFWWSRWWGALLWGLLFLILLLLASWILRAGRSVAERRHVETPSPPAPPPPPDPTPRLKARSTMRRLRRRSSRPSSPPSRTASSRRWRCVDRAARRRLPRRRHPRLLLRRRSNRCIPCAAAWPPACLPRLVGRFRRRGRDARPAIIWARGSICGDQLRRLRQSVQTTSRVVYHGQGMVGTHEAQAAAAASLEFLVAGDGLVDAIVQERMGHALGPPNVLPS